MAHSSCFVSAVSLADVSLPIFSCAVALQLHKTKQKNKQRMCKKKQVINQFAHFISCFSVFYRCEESTSSSGVSNSIEGIIEEDEEEEAEEESNKKRMKEDDQEVLSNSTFLLVIFT